MVSFITNLVQIKFYSHLQEKTKEQMKHCGNIIKDSLSLKDLISYSRPDEKNNLYLRIWSICALSQEKEKSSVAVLGELLKDKSSIIRLTIIDSLGDIPLQESLDILTSQLDKEQAGILQELVKQSIKKVQDKLAKGK